MRKLKNGLVTDIENEDIIKKLEAIPIPSVLKKKLVIGDEAQIQALRELDDRIGVYEYIDEDERVCGTYKYVVEVRVEGSITIEVEASDDSEAKEIAAEEVNMGDMDIEDTECSIISKRPLN